MMKLDTTLDQPTTTTMLGNHDRQNVSKNLTARQTNKNTKLSSKLGSASDLEHDYVDTGKVRNKIPCERYLSITGRSQ